MGNAGRCVYGWRNRGRGRGIPGGERRGRKGWTQTESPAGQSQHLASLLCSKVPFIEQSEHKENRCDILNRQECVLLHFCLGGARKKEDIPFPVPLRAITPQAWQLQASPWKMSTPIGQVWLLGGQANQWIRHALPLGLIQFIHYGMGMCHAVFGG